MRVVASSDKALILSGDVVVVVKVVIVSNIANGRSGTRSVHGDRKDRIVETWRDELGIGHQDCDDVVDVISAVRIVLKGRVKDTAVRVRCNSQQPLLKTSSVQRHLSYATCNK